MNTTNHEALDALILSLAAATALPAETIANQLSHPPKPEMGDYAMPCFQFAKANKLAPPAAAAQLAEKLNADPALKNILEKAETAGAFLNIRFKPSALASSVIRAIKN